jgi:hypothetical protein
VRDITAVMGREPRTQVRAAVEPDSFDAPPILL